MTREETVKLIEEYIANNETAEALEHLTSCPYVIRKEVVILNNRFRKAQEEIRMSVVSAEDSNRELNKINIAIYDLAMLITSATKEDSSGASVQGRDRTDFLPEQLEKTVAKGTTVIKSAAFQLDKTLDKKAITLDSSTGASLEAIELTTKDGRVQNGGTVFRIQTAAVLGRHPDCDIVLLDQGISRFHTRIVRKEGVLIISDENSTNGTFWNNESINSLVITADGLLRLDEIEFELKVIKE